MIILAQSIKKCRVVITGMGALSPFGRGVDTMFDALKAGRTAVERDEALAEYGALASHVVAKAPKCDTKWINRHKRRYMSAMSVYAAIASDEAIKQANLDLPDAATDRIGLCMGSTTGSTGEYEKIFARLLSGAPIDSFMSTHFFKIMNHSVSANIGQALGIRGMVHNISCACATGGVAIGTGYQFIATGLQDAMICGGADEYHPFTTGIFEIMNASSTGFNAVPDQTPRPFDVKRDGVVCSEGAGVMVLESLEHARKRNAPIIAEITGYAMRNGPDNIAHPDADLMSDCICGALADAGISPDEVDYVNAHATGTEVGDMLESQGIAQAIGSSTPVSSLKGHMGHSMAASGALEAIASVEMMRQGRLIKTRNLTEPDPDCADLAYLTEDISPGLVTTVVKNSLAMGGVHTTLVLRRWAE